MISVIFSTKGALGPKGRFYRSTLCGAYSSEASLKKAKRLKEPSPMVPLFVHKAADAAFGGFGKGFKANLKAVHGRVGGEL